MLATAVAILLGAACGCGEPFRYYLLNTSGCSCPDPADEWRIVFGPATFDEMEKHIRGPFGEEAYGVTKRQYDEFLALIDDAKRFESAEP